MHGWSLPHLVEPMRDALARENDERDREQAPHGIDELDELALHTLLARGLAAHYDVAREVHYPSAFGTAAQKQRCDLVLARNANTTTPTADEPLWLELKVAHQLLPGDRRNPRYGTQWRRAITSDLRKMIRDPRIAHAALGFVVFTADEATLAHDLRLFETLLSQKELVCGTRSVASLPLVDRIGHRLATVVLWPMLRVD